MTERRRTASETHAAPEAPVAPKGALATDGTPARSLDDWKAEVGEPNKALHRAVFLGTTDAKMVERGREIDTSVILTHGPNVLASTRSIWTGLSTAQRRLCKGYQPALDAILVAELLNLRATNAKYDSKAQAGTISVAQRRSSAKTAFSAGVILRRAAADTLKDYLGETHSVVVGVLAALKSAESADILAASMEAVARALKTLRHGSDGYEVQPDELLALDFAQLDDDMVTALEQGAKRVRESEEMATAKPHEIAVAQRALDLQDGRALHVIGLIVRAFRRARRSDETVLVPELGGVGRLFESTRARTDDEDEDPAKPTDDPVKPVA